MNGIVDILVARGIPTPAKDLADKLKHEEGASEILQWILHRNNEENSLPPTTPLSFVDLLSKCHQMEGFEYDPPAEVDFSSRRSRNQLYKWLGDVLTVSPKAPSTLSIGSPLKQSYTPSPLRRSLRKSPLAKQIKRKRKKSIETPPKRSPRKVIPVVVEEEDYSPMSTLRQGRVHNNIDQYKILKEQQQHQYSPVQELEDKMQLQRVMEEVIDREDKEREIMMYGEGIERRIEGLKAEEESILSLIGSQGDSIAFQEELQEVNQQITELEGELVHWKQILVQEKVMIEQMKEKAQVYMDKVIGYDMEDPEKALEYIRMKQSIYERKKQRMLAEDQQKDQPTYQHDQRSTQVVDKIQGYIHRYQLLQDSKSILLHGF